MIKLTHKQQKARRKVCLALDGVKCLEDIKSLVDALGPYVGMFKIGKETFTRLGPESVRLVQSMGSGVFLDLKYHDIPNTVKAASTAASELGACMFNVHCSGGLEMLKAAVAGVKCLDAKSRPKVLGVTILTSISKEIMNNELNIYGDVDAQVLHLAKLANRAGLDGIVCSANDLKYIREKLPKDFMFVTPGIRLPGSPESDQKRTDTPSSAIRAGATIIVVGRAITCQDNKVRTALDVLDDIAKVL